MFRKLLIVPALALAGFAVAPQAGASPLAGATAALAETTPAGVQKATFLGFGYGYAPRRYYGRRGYYPRRYGWRRGYYGPRRYGWRRGYARYGYGPRRYYRRW